MAEPVKRTERKLLDVTVFEVKRLRNSAVGNPAWQLVTDAGVLETKANASVGYQISSFWQDHRVRLVLENGKVTDTIDLP